VVLNCAGPSHHVGDRVAAAALTAGAGYVDPGGDEPLHASLVRTSDPGRPSRAVLSAGMMPGLSAIVPRWMAQQSFERTAGLTAFVRLRNRFTPAAAADYLLSEQRGYGESLAGWQHGARRSHALEPLIQIELPYFQTRVNAYPYLSREADRLAATLGLSDLRWYHLFDDHRIVSLVARLQQRLAGGEDVAAAADVLVREVDLELFGREPSIEMVFELTGEDRTGAGPRTVRFRATDTYESSGALAALAADALLSGQVPPGVHFAADVLDASSVVARIREAPAIGVVERLDAVVEQGAADDEGVV
jgi:hypothetical protein